MSSSSNIHLTVRLPVVARAGSSDAWPTSDANFTKPVNSHRVKQATLKLKGRYLPASTLGQAIDYALGQLPRLEAWLKDGRFEIDNNQVENAILPTALGKKN